MGEVIALLMFAFILIFVVDAWTKKCRKDEEDRHREATKAIFAKHAEESKLRQEARARDAETAIWRRPSYSSDTEAKRQADARTDEVRRKRVNDAHEERRKRTEDDNFTVLYTSHHLISDAHSYSSDSGSGYSSDCSASDSGNSSSVCD